MKHLSIVLSPQRLVLENWQLEGENVTSSERNIKHLEGVFADALAWSKLNPETLVYRVQVHLPIQEGTAGGVYMGNTTIYPGKVGNEYFMTRGHFHALADRTEYYWGVQGQGMLILMDVQRNTWAERMYPGSLHFIPPGVAHRVANTGSSPLIFGASWPADAGHNYGEIEKNGFSARLMEVDGTPTLVEN